MKDISKVIIFNILVILTIVLIFLLFFPKKSYIAEKLNVNPEVEETFKNNINSLKIASINYLEKNEKETVSLQELIDKNLLVELKDSNGNTCSNKSYAKKEDNKIIVNLKCSDKEDEITEYLQKNYLLCLYEYRKDTEKGYTDWSEWSEWSTDKKEKNDLTNVEEKIEQEPDGKEFVTKTREVYVDAFKNKKISCPSGYKEENGSCKTKTEINSISPSIAYSCPEGYRRSGVNCYSDYETIQATRSYFCPSSQGSVEFELVGEECKSYRISYISGNDNGNYYSCPEGYELSDTKCLATEEYEEEVQKYKDVKYYRYQTREETEKNFDIIWSSKDNKDLLNKSYNMIREISCDF